MKLSLKLKSAVKINAELEAYIKSVKSLKLEEALVQVEENHRLTK